MSRPTPRMLRFSSTGTADVHHNDHKDESEMLVEQLRKKSAVVRITKDLAQQRIDHLRPLEKEIDETDWLYESKNQSKF